MKTDTAGSENSLYINTINNTNVGLAILGDSTCAKESPRIASPTFKADLTGNNDHIIYPWHTEALYKKAKKPKEIIHFKDGLHADDIYLKMKEDFIIPCDNWFKKTLG